MKLQQHCSIFSDAGSNIILKRFDSASVYFYGKNILFSIPNNIKFFLAATAGESHFSNQRTLCHFKESMRFFIGKFRNAHLITSPILFSVAHNPCSFNTWQLFSKVSFSTNTVL